MKKKFKLFATIGSLCLAVAMMTIGVLAAKSVTLNVTSNVNFTTETVLVDIAGEVTGAVEGTKNYAGFTHSATDVNAAPEAWAIGALSFDEEHQTIKYVITVTNQSEFAIKIEGKNAADFPQTEAGKLEVTSTHSANATSFAKGESATYTVTIKLIDFSTSFDAAKNVNFDVTATKA